METSNPILIHFECLFTINRRREKEVMQSALAAVSHFKSNSNENIFDQTGGEANWPRASPIFCN